LIAAVIQRFDGQRYELVAYVVMNDHVHVLVRPLLQYELHEILHSWKSYSAHQMQRDSRRRGQIWQHEYFDRIVRDDKELSEKINYILQNPWKRWPEINEYRWVWPLES
jgi:REP element-mobilizing transposase RayT